MKEFVPNDEKAKEIKESVSKEEKKKEEEEEKKEGNLEDENEIDPND
ncbi:hypothetical protein [Staphylococcus sp. GDK8D30P]|nr:hypothetical protein [Staphylococcus sp. GDK8D30P]